jgi:hypothetical protein
VLKNVDNKKERKNMRELVIGKNNLVIEAVKEILFDFIIFGLFVGVSTSLILFILGQSNPTAGGIAFGAWSFAIAATLHTIITDGTAVAVGIILLLWAVIVYGIGYLFYWMLFL